VLKEHSFLPWGIARLWHSCPLFSRLGEYFTGNETPSISFANKN